MKIENLTIMMTIDGKNVLVDSSKINVYSFYDAILFLQGGKKLKVYELKNVEIVNEKDFTKKGNDKDAN